MKLASISLNIAGPDGDQIGWLKTKEAFSVRSAHDLHMGLNEEICGQGGT